MRVWAAVQLWMLRVSKLAGEHVLLEEMAAAEQGALAGCYEYRDQAVAVAPSAECYSRDACDDNAYVGAYECAGV